MAEPSSSTVVAVVTAGAFASIVPFAPQLAVVLLFGAGGGLVASTKARTRTTLAVLGWGLRGAIFAAAFSWVIAQRAGIDVSQSRFMWLAPIAFATGLYCHHWPAAYPAVKGALFRALGVKEKARDE